MTLTFNDVKFLAEFNRISSEVKNPKNVLLAAGREVGNRLRRHFRLKDRTEANQLSPRRSHFWLQVARSVPE